MSKLDGSENMIKIKCPGCDHVWNEEHENIRPLRCSSCGKEWLKADLIFVIESGQEYKG